MSIGIGWFGLAILFFSMLDAWRTIRFRRLLKDLEVNDRIIDDQITTVNRMVVTMAEMHREYQRKFTVLNTLIDKIKPFAEYLEKTY